MPTTRGTAIKTSSNVDVQTNEHRESASESRKARFLARKKRDPPTDPSPKQRIMIQFLNAVINVDKRYILWTRPTTEQAVTFESIEDRVYKGKYKDLSSFKKNFDELLLSIIPTARSYHKDMSAFKAVNAFTENSLRFESKRLKEEITDTDAFFELTALFRPTTDGYSFTDLSLKDPSVGPITNLPPNVQEIVIHPAPPAEKEEVPTLKQVVAPPPKYYPKIFKHEEKPVVPVQWLDFGAFSSFAPASDSNNANATYEYTYMGRHAKRLKKNQHNHAGEEKDDMDTDDAEVNAAWLAKEGLDMDIIEAAMNKPLKDVDEKLERNGELLEELLSYQKTRFEGGESQWTAVNEKEVEIAKTLENNMADMLAKLPPNATSNNELIEKTMERLPLLEPAYRGTLPPHKIFSFPTTEKAENLPPYANITPTYSKDNWRLVKVAPLPSKDGKDQKPPLMSMVEQQISFYPKPQYPQPMIQQPQPQPQARMPMAGAPQIQQQPYPPYQRR